MRRAPAPGNNGLGTLTIQNALTFKADVQYDCEIDLKKARADKVSASGVCLAGSISLVPLRSRRLTPGTVFTISDNTSSQPITGTFNNLPDRSVVTVRGNTLQANYQGGDGNDLTLTVIP